MSSPGFPPSNLNAPSTQTLIQTWQNVVTGINNLSTKLDSALDSSTAQLTDIVTELTGLVAQTTSLVTESAAQVTQQTAIVAQATASVTQLTNINTDLQTINTTLSAVFPLHTLTGSATYNPPSIAPGASVTTTVTVTGAVMGNYVVPSFSLDLAGLTLTAYVSSANTVTCVFANLTSGAIDLASGTLAARVFG